RKSGTWASPSPRPTTAASTPPRTTAIREPRFPGEPGASAPGEGVRLLRGLTPPARRIQRTRMTDDIDMQTIDLALALEVRPLPAFDRPLEAQVREVRLLTSPPWARALGKLTLE